MGRDLDLPVADRLAKLIRLLGSDRDGEVVATVGAIKRTLEGAGLDLHSLAKMINGENSASKGEIKRAYRDGFQDGYRTAEEEREDDDDADDQPTWYEAAKFCEARAARFNTYERDFIRNMVRWTARGREPSEKQARWLDSLFVRLGGGAE